MRCAKMVRGPRRKAKARCLGIAASGERYCFGHGGRRLTASELIREKVKRNPKIAIRSLQVALFDAWLASGQPWPKAPTEEAQPIVEGKATLKTSWEEFGRRLLDEPLVNGLIVDIREPTWD